MDHRITDEELSRLKNHYERIMQGWQNPKDFPGLLTLVASMLTRIESEREKEGAEIGPDYFGKIVGGEMSVTVNRIKDDVSVFLKKRILHCKNWGWNNARLQLETVHKALCGEVGDENNKN